MQSRAWLSLLLLVGVSAVVSAQSHGYGSPPGAGYQGAETVPYGASPARSWGGEPSAMPYPEAGFAPPMESGPPPAERATGVQSGPDPAAQASAVLKEGMDKLLTYLAQEEIPDQLQVAAFLDREVAPYFDFDYMARWAAGQAYAGMTPEERKALAAQLEADFLGTLTRHLSGYDGQQVRLLAPRPGPRGAVSINVAVLQAGNYPTTLQFRMSDSDGRWRVYDVLANGQSAAAYYRTQFRRMERRVGVYPH